MLLIHSQIWYNCSSSYGFIVFHCTDISPLLSIHWQTCACFCLLWILLLWTLTCQHLFEHLLSVLLSIYQEGDCRAMQEFCLSFPGTAKVFSRASALFILFYFRFLNFFRERACMHMCLHKSGEGLEGGRHRGNLSSRPHAEHGGLCRVQSHNPRNHDPSQKSRVGWPTDWVSQAPLATLFYVSPSDDEGSHFSTSPPTLVIFYLVLFYNSHLVGTKWRFIVVWICISVITDGV